MCEGGQRVTGAATLLSNSALPPRTEQGDLKREVPRARFIHSDGKVFAYVQTLTNNSHEETPSSINRWADHGLARARREHVCLHARGCQH